MKITIACTLMLLVAVACQTSPGTASNQTVTFEAPVDVVGAAPTGWTTAEMAGTGTAAEWRVIEDQSAPVSANVLNVATHNAEATFNMCLFDGLVARDVEVSANLKPLSGQTDQGGGIMCRVQDSLNYDLTRWNPLERSVRLYTVRGGKRTTLQSVEIDVTPGWHKLTLRCTGRTLVVFFDGTKVTSATVDEDERAGKIGLWTKSDATTSFDDVDIRLL